MSAWHRSSHASGWGVVAATKSRGRAEDLLDGRCTLLPGRELDDRFAPTILLQQSESSGRSPRDWAHLAVFGLFEENAVCQRITPPELKNGHPGSIEIRDSSFLERATRLISGEPSAQTKISMHNRWIRGQWTHRLTLDIMVLTLIDLHLVILIKIRLPPALMGFSTGARRHSQSREPFL